jgi:hypothetical protein
MSEQSSTVLLPPEPIRAIDLAAHQKDLERRAAERAKKQPLLDKCLNPADAAKEEARKPRWKWRVTCDVPEPKKDDNGQPAGIEWKEKTAEVVAMDADEAWAMANCSLKWKTMYGPKEVRNRKITKLKRFNPDDE